MPHYTSLDEAPRVLKQSQRVLVIGTSGGGKTTLSLRIAEIGDLEHISIDRDVRWLPGWAPRPKAEQRRLLSDLVAKDRWVMDGSGASTFDIRVPRADLIVWIRVPRVLALWGVLNRVVRNYGEVRVAMAEGCSEPFPDRAFLSYIWHFERRSAPQFISQIDRYGPQVPVVVLRSRAHCAEFIRTAQNGCGG